MNDRVKKILATAAPVGITALVITGILLAWHFTHLPPDAQAPITIPSVLAIQSGDIATLEAQTTGGAKGIKWFSPSKKVHVFSMASNNSVIVHARTPGVYHVVAIGLDGKGRLAQPAICEVTVGNPGPGPAPVPPAPVPPTPGPSDPLVQKIQAAYGSETANDKAASLAALGEVYAQGATAATARTDLATWGAFFQVLEDAAKAVGVNGKIMGVQAVIQSELTKALPTATATAFDATARALAGSTLTRIAAAVKSVK